MRILFALPYRPWPPLGGGPTRSWHLLRYLAPRHEVHLFALDTRARVSSPSPAEDPNPYASCTFVPVPTLNPRRGSPAWLALRLRSLRHPAAGYYRRDAARAFADLVRRVQPELVVYGFSWVLPYARAAPRTPALADEHNCDPHLAQRVAETQRGIARLRWRLYVRLTTRAERRNLRHVQAVAAVSPEDAAAFRRLAPHALVDVVPNGVDVTGFAPVPLGASVVMTGSFDYRPNIEGARRLVRSIWPLVRREAPEATLRLVGLEGERTLADLAGAPGVAVVGTVEDVRAELAGARVAVAPLDVGGGTRIKILEAFALARPVVATPLAAEGLAVRNEEHLLIRESDPAFAAAVVRLLRDDALAETIGRQARLLVEALYDWGVTAARFEALVRRVAR